MNEEIPENTPPLFEKVMTACWSQNPSDRLSAEMVLAQLQMYESSTDTPVSSASSSPVHSRTNSQNPLSDSRTDSQKEDKVKASFFRAAKLGDRKKLSVCSIYQRDGLSTRDSEGNTALHHAAANGHLELVKWLVKEQGMNVSERNQAEETALLLAAQIGKQSVVEWLIQSGGVDERERNSQGASVLLLAAEQGHLSLVAWLVETGVSSITEKDKQQNTVFSSPKEAVVLWVTLYRDLSQTSNPASSASFEKIQAYQGENATLLHFTTVKTLIQWGAKQLLKSYQTQITNWWSAFSEAEKSAVSTLAASKRLMAFLPQSGAQQTRILSSQSLNQSTGSTTSTPILAATRMVSPLTPTSDVSRSKQDELICCLRKGDLDTVKKLESEGASFLYPDKNAEYPLVAAIYGCSLETVEYVELKLKNEAAKQWSQVDANKAIENINRWMPTKIAENTTYAELGNWYVKYEGASWCNYYDSECLKKCDRQNWGGWDGEYREVVWKIGGKELWGYGGCREKWHGTMRAIEKNTGISDYARHSSAWRGLLSPSVEAHNEVVKTIREQLNKLKKEVENKVIGSAILERNAEVQTVCFVPLYVPYTNTDQSAKEQATKILAVVSLYHQKGYQKIGITYSANHDQTIKIKQSYRDGEWQTNVFRNGKNQSKVMEELEKLLALKENSHLQNIFRILPITTCDKSGGKGKVEQAWLDRDLEDIEAFIKNPNHLVLGWKNQDSGDGYAIGGGVSKKLLPKQNKFIQDKLKYFEKNCQSFIASSSYHGSPISQPTSPISNRLTTTVATTVTTTTTNVTSKPPTPY